MDDGIEIAVVLLVGLAWVASGVVAWRQRPDNRLGPLMVFIGVAWYASWLVEAVEDVYLAGFVALVLTFPTGRLRGRLDGWLIAAAVVLVLPVKALWAVTDEDAIVDAQRVVGLVLSVFTIALLVDRWSRASAAQRRAVAPVLWTGSAMFAALTLSIVNDILDQPLGEAPTWLRAGVFASIPIAVLAVLLQRRLARSGVAGLVVELGRSGERPQVQAALARALGDPSLELLFCLPDGGRHVRPDGSPAELPEPSAQRAVTFVEREGGPVAALVHDAALQENPELVDSVCAAAGLTLENERLRAELLARVADLQASRARLVDATDRERRRIERDLHDGTQQRLVSVALTLGLAESRLQSGQPAEPILREARAALGEALAELREISHGIRPPVLAERGLPAALDDLRRRAAVPVSLDLAGECTVPDSVGTAAYYVASEALANVAKHARATAARIAVERTNGALVLEVADDGVGGAERGTGSGLAGLEDRVGALGGRLTVTSREGEGTVLRAEIPCG